MIKTILIVEDFDDARSFMKFLVESYGYKVVEATNGIEALEIFENDSPDMILMDIAMPLMDGLTATRTIRVIKRDEKTPIVAITAHGKDFFNKAIEAGCNDVISKPLDLDSLQTVISHYLEV